MLARLSITSIARGLSGAGRFEQRVARRWLLGVVAACLCGLTSGPSGAQALRALGPLDDQGRVTYFIGEGTPGSGYRAADHELATWALAAWERAAKGAITLAPAAEETALVRIYWVSAGAGQYGEMRPLDVDGRRGAAVFIRPDTTALGPDIAERAVLDALFRDTVVYLTCLHELGHAFGLEHTADFADVMYAFGYGGDIPEFFDRYRRELGTRTDIGGTPGLSSGDLTQLHGLYDVEP
jgi:hypothetical protein